MPIIALFGMSSLPHDDHDHDDFSSCCCSCSRRRIFFVVFYIPDKDVMDPSRFEDTLTNFNDGLASSVDVTTVARSY